jgi:hypothetical protein
MFHNPLNIVFTKALTENKWPGWLHLVRHLMDIFIYLNMKKCLFGSLRALVIFKSLYIDHMNGEISYLRKYIWKLKVSLNIRIFCFFIKKF